MLKKFNLLVEQIIDKINKDYRFNRNSYYLSKNLTDQEKIELNKKFDEEVKEQLLAAEKSQQPITIYFSNQKTYSTRPNCIIEKVWEQNGTWYCKFLNNHYQQTIKYKLNDFRLASSGQEKQLWEKDPKQCKKIAEQKAREECEKTQPINHITTDKILKEIQQYQQERKNVKLEDHLNIFEKANDSVKFAVDNNLVSKEFILKCLNERVAEQKNLSKYCKPEDYENLELLAKFGIKTSDKEFEKAKKDSNQDLGSESAYYVGGWGCTLTADLHVTEGERFDINRVNVDNFSHKYSHDEGHPADF